MKHLNNNKMLEMMDNENARPDSILIQIRKNKDGQPVTFLIFYAAYNHNQEYCKMQKISWNDINDSDSSLESQPEQEIHQTIKQNDKNQSKKELTSNSKNSCDQYSLQKLQKHSSTTMWLYITNTNSQKAEEINQLLTKSNNFTQIIRLINVGWNVETTSEIGRQLIYQGLKGDNLFIRFIYSKKNQQRQSRQEQKQKHTKLQKKVTYIQKGKQLTIKKFNTFTEQTKSKELIQGQEVYSPRTKEQKQKSKWVQKNNTSNSFNDFKRFQSPRANKNLRYFKSPKRYIEKAASNKESNKVSSLKKEQKDVVYEQQEEKIKEKSNKIQHQSNMIEQIKIDKIDQKIDCDQQKQTIQKKSETKVDQEDEQSQQEVKQQKKKKQKKKRDGKAKKQQNKQESNNPFSYFSRF